MELPEEITQKEVEEAAVEETLTPLVRKVLTALYFSKLPYSNARSAKKFYKLSSYYLPQISLALIEKFLQSVAQFSLFYHKRGIKRNSINYVYDIGDLIGFDICHLKHYEETSGDRYILIFQDFLSRKAFPYPLKNRTAKEIISTIDKFLASFKSHLTKYSRLYSDRESALASLDFKKLLSKYKIRHINSYANHHVSFVENLQRQIRNMTNRKLSYRQSGDVSQLFIDSIDAFNAQAQSILLDHSPNEVFADKSLQVAVAMVNNTNKPPQAPKSLKVGDYVRKVQTKMKFSKEINLLDPNYSYSIFKIIKVSHLHPLPRFILQQIGSSVVEKRKYYENELIKVDHDEAESEYVIDKIIKTDAKNSRTLVSFKGYKGNFWVPSSSIQSTKGKTNY